jgi:hypothetical protein
LGLTCLKACDDVQIPAGLAVSIWVTTYNVPPAAVIIQTATGSDLGGLLLRETRIVHSVFGVYSWPSLRGRNDNLTAPESVNTALSVNQHPSVRFRQARELVKGGM